ncbi:GNAT family N-acetyltransferase [Pseudooceanicola sp. C21-150M6]|uniref:GNAT family N-acetyltransferase n=1 Tax=Pseudooceanicola sp. C21-150M6 TaxID=3434355 RepID=UPI003D7F5817
MTPVPAPIRLSPNAPEIPATRDLLIRAFAYMEGRIDPPSSLGRMTEGSLRRDAEEKELWIIPGPGLPGQSISAPLACVILTPDQHHLYIGKLAVDETARGLGLARVLLDHAGTRARSLGLPLLRLQTRVELTENHATFMALGFQEVGRTAHSGYDRPTSITYERAVNSDGPPAD